MRNDETEYRAALSELDLSIYTLNYIAEDYGHLVDVAIERVVETIEVLKTENYELALKLSQIYEKEEFWAARKNAAYQDYVEVLEQS